MESGEGRETYPSSREKVDYSDFREEMGGKEERPNRPHSRDSTLSKESRGSKEGKGSIIDPALKTYEWLVYDLHSPCGTDLI